MVRKSLLAALMLASCSSATAKLNRPWVIPYLNNNFSYDKSSDSKEKKEVNKQLEIDFKVSYSVKKDDFPFKDSKPLEKINVDDPFNEKKKDYSKYFNGNVPLDDIIKKEVKKRISIKNWQRKIVIEKADRILGLYLVSDNEDIPLKEYRIALSPSARGDKKKQGDLKTPEGFFYIPVMFVHHSYYKSLLISYPNKEDAKQGFNSGIINKWQRDSIIRSIDNCQVPLQATKLGSDILIHGGGSSYDWTAGCTALDNSDMDEIYSFTEPGCSKKKVGNKYKLVPNTLVVITP